MGRVSHPWLLLTIVFSLATMGRSQECVYTLFIRTESIPAADTDSRIGVTLYNAGGSALVIDDLETWGGLMGPGHNYFEQGGLDIFSGRGSCLSGGVCAINLTSDGSGPYPGWFCNYVEVNTIRVHFTPVHHLFTVNQWLDLNNPPNQLYAYRNDCASSAADDDKIIPHAARAAL